MSEKKVTRRTFAKYAVGAVGAAALAAVGGYYLLNPRPATTPLSTMSSSTMSSSTSNTSLADMLRKAQAEGEVDVIGGTSYQPLSVDAQVQSYLTTNYGIKFNFTSVTTDVGVEKVLAEVNAGKLEYDMAMFSQSIQWLNLQPYLASYTSPNYARYDPKYIDPQMRYFWCDKFFECMMYNTDQVTTPITSWWDMTKPQFKGRVAITDPRSTGNIWQLWYYLWKTLGSQFYQGLANNQVVVYDSATTYLPKLASGEILIGQMLDTSGRAQVEKGAPVKLAYPTEGSVEIGHYAGIFAQAPHPNAARVFMNWLSSQPGQEAIVRTAKVISLYPGVAGPTGAPTGNVATTQVDVQEANNAFKDISPQIAKILGLSV